MKNLNYFDLQFRSQITDFKRRKKYIRKELNNIVLKAVLETGLDDNKSYLSKSKASPKNFLKTFIAAKDQLQNYKQNTYTRVRNRCVLTGRSSTLKLFRQSRISFREQAALGQLPGISKRLNK